MTTEVEKIIDTVVAKLKQHAADMKHREENLRKEINTLQAKLDATMGERMKFESFIYKTFEEKAGKP